MFGCYHVTFKSKCIVKYFRSTTRNPSALYGGNRKLRQEETVRKHRWSPQWNHNRAWKSLLLNRLLCLWRKIHGWLKDRGQTILLVLNRWNYIFLYGLQGLTTVSLSVASFLFGTPEAAVRARAQSWSRRLSFLSLRIPKNSKASDF